MNIAFLCITLEPGRDGVGDYIRRLACEVKRQGHSVKLISLNDVFIQAKIEGTQQSDGIEVPVLRIPGKWPLQTRLNLAKNHIEKFNPDWVSMQFVIFGFHPKGLPIGIGKKLKTLGNGHKWHIMFHEVWLGLQYQSTFKQKVIGKIQRYLIKNVVYALNPAVIHTHAGFYQQQLINLGFKVKQLSLFGNIPQLYSNVSGLDSSQLKFVIFGAIHPHAPIENFAAELAVYAKINHLIVTIIFVGRCGTEQKHWVKSCEINGIITEEMGEQSVNKVSEIFAQAAFGLTTTPSVLIGKSSSVSSMHENGLPVICVNAPWEAKGVDDIQIPTGVFSYKQGNLNSILVNSNNKPLLNNVSIIAQQLLQSLA